MGIVGAEIMQRFARVLFEMQALDADRNLLGRGEVDQHHAFADDGVLVLADLISLGKVGIEVILAVEHRAQVDLRLEAEAGADRLRHAFLVDHREHARHGRIDQRDMAVGRAAEFGRGAGKQLRLARHLGMDFEADDDFPVAGGAGDEFCGMYVRAHLESISPPDAFIRRSS